MNDLIKPDSPQFNNWNELCTYIQNDFKITKPGWHWCYMGELAVIIVGVKYAGMLYEKWLMGDK